MRGSKKRFKPAYPIGKLQDLKRTTRTKAITSVTYQCMLLIDRKIGKLQSSYGRKLGSLELLQLVRDFIPSLTSTKTLSDKPVTPGEVYRALRFIHEHITPIHERWFILAYKGIHPPPMDQYDRCLKGRQES